MNPDTPTNKQIINYSIMNKREFIKSSLYAAGGIGLSMTVASCKKSAQQQKSDEITSNEDIKPLHIVRSLSKRDRVLAVLDRSKPNEYVPAAFFMHFKDKVGAGAVKTHIEFFRATNMDFSKIQYETVLPRQEIKNPKDWAKIPVYGQETYGPQLEVIKEIVKELKSEALIIPTVYSPLLLAASIAGPETYLAHAKENPDAVAKGVQNLTENILYYIRESIKLGVDGFYLSTHGGDKAVFYDEPLFEKLIKPYDDIIFKEANDNSLFNILHICSPENTYQKLDHLAAYPSSVINPPVILNDGTKTDLKGVQQLFGRPVMSGLDHHGVITNGTLEEIKKEVDDVFTNNAPQNFIFAANCTVPSETSWENLRGTVDYAHDWRITH
jgi:uroporphyrinogen decarboxylase